MPELQWSANEDETSHDESDSDDAVEARQQRTVKPRAGKLTGVSKRAKASNGDHPQANDLTESPLRDGSSSDSDSGPPPLRDVLEDTESSDEDTDEEDIKLR